MAHMTFTFFLERLRLRSFSLAILAICVASSTVVAQSASQRDDNATQKSILVQASESNPAMSSGANGTASIETPLPQITFTRQEFSQAPQPPSELLTPSTPSGEQFTKPFVNELRGEKVSSVSSNGPSNSTQTSRGTQSDGSQAIGTHATTNPRFQEQPAVDNGFSPPKNGFQAPRVNFDSLGVASSQIGGTPPPITSSAREANQPPVLSSNFGSGAQSRATVSEQPSAWRDVTPNSNSQKSVQSYNMKSEAIGQSSRANMMQPVQSQPSWPDQTQAQPQSPNGQRSFNPQPTDRLAQRQMQNTNRDDLVRPTGFSQPIGQPANPQPRYAPPKKRSTALAKSLIDRYATDNFDGSALPGQPVRMIEMLNQPISPQQRRPMVSQFWLTYYDWANMISDQKYEQWLNQIPAATSVSDKAMIEAAKAMAKNQSLSAEIQLGKSQSQLMQYMPNRQSTTLPLPNELPLIQPYRTSYELYKSQRMLPVSLLGIDEMLPKTLELIKQRADAVQIAKTAADTVVSALQSRQTTIATVLEAGDVWRAAEQDLVASVVDYNQAIGDYALSIPHGYSAPNQIAEMLTRRVKTQNVAQPSQTQAPVRNSSAQVQFGGSQSQAELRRQIAARQQAAVQQRFANQQQQRNAQQDGGSTQFGNPPQGRTAQANPGNFLEQARSDAASGQGRNFGAAGGNANSGQTRNAQNGFNLEPNAFSGNGRGQVGNGGGGSNSAGGTNSSVAPMTPLKFGQQPKTDPFAAPPVVRGSFGQ